MSTDTLKHIISVGSLNQLSAGRLYISLLPHVHAQQGQSNTFVPVCYQKNAQLRIEHVVNS